MAVNTEQPTASLTELTQEDLCKLLNYLVEVRGNQNFDLVNSLHVNGNALSRIANSLERIADVLAAKEVSDASV